jgi:hypothetical protein
MRVVRYPSVVVLVSLIVTAGAVRAGHAQSAEPPLTALEIAVACAPPTSFDVPDTNLRVTGAQDTEALSLFEPRHSLVLSGGTRDGVALGQKYFVRRPIHSQDHRSTAGIMTLGWLSVVAVNETTAIGSIDHFCDGMQIDDYLEPYARPVIPAGADRDEPAGDPDFSTLGRVVSGIATHSTVGIGNLMLIDRGTDQGVEPGARFAVYRDVRTGVPLTSVGEAVVVSIGKSMSLARVTRSRDAIVAGDYIVPRK